MPSGGEEWRHIEGWLPDPWPWRCQRMAAGFFSKEFPMGNTQSILHRDHMGSSLMDGLGISWELCTTKGLKVGNMQIYIYILRNPMWGCPLQKHAIFFSGCSKRSEDFKTYMFSILLAKLQYFTNHMASSQDSSPSPVPIILSSHEANCFETLIKPKVGHQWC